MLTEMYLALMSHVRTDAATLDMAQHHHDVWRETQMEKKRLESEERTKHQTMVVEPQRIYQEQLTAYLQKLSDLKKMYFKSTANKKRGVLEQWLNEHNEGIQTLLTQTPPT